MKTIPVFILSVLIVMNYKGFSQANSVKLKNDSIIPCSAEMLHFKKKGEKCFDSENFYRTKDEINTMNYDRRKRIVKMAIRRYGCISSKQAIELATYLNTNAVCRFARFAVTYINDIENFYTIKKQCNKNANARVSRRIEKEIERRSKNKK